MRKIPTLLWDEDCAFCARWIKKWQKITGDKVNYFPCQKALVDYPEIKAQDCRQSVQFILSDNAVLTGAKAVFKTLSFSDPYQWLWWSYEHIPLFAPISEGVYKLIARNRTFFSRFL